MCESFVIAVSYMYVRRLEEDDKSAPLSIRQAHNVSDTIQVNSRTLPLPMTFRRSFTSQGERDILYLCFTCSQRTYLGFHDHCRMRCVLLRTHASAQDELAQLTAGYCGADMKALCSEATLLAVRRYGTSQESLHLLFARTPEVHRLLDGCLG